MHDHWICRLELALKEALQLLARTTGENTLTWIDLPLARLKDALERLNSLKASAAELRGRTGRASPQDERVRQFERYAQLNALRIAIIDLNEICEDLTQSYWVCALGLQSRDGAPSVVDRVMSSANLKKGLRGSCGALLDEGHSHVNNLRNALVHFSYTEYATQVIDEEPTAPIKAVFKFAQATQNPKNAYYNDVFSPFCQLGERNGSGDDDFSRSNRNGLNACLFSAGRLTADMAEAFHQRLPELGAG